MRVLVLGAGYAGLALARRLEDSLPGGVELVVVDETGGHLVQHELHRAIRRPEIAEEIRVDLADALDRADVRVATVEGIDRERRTVELADGELDYDVAAVCLGAETADYGIEGVTEYGTPLKRLDHARTVREEFDALAACGQVVVVGAGLSGVQVAGELAELAGEHDIDVTLLERLDDVAPRFDRRFRSAVREELESRNVDVRTGTVVERVTADRIDTDAGGLGYDQFVWTGGIRGPAALGGERPEVRATLAVDDRTFVVGDAGRVVDSEGEPVPASAQAAVREARTAATNLTRVVETLRAGDPRPRLEQFTFDSPGWLVSVGDGAVAQVGPLVLRGRAARALKGGVGAGYLASAGDPAGALGLLRGGF